MPGWTLVDTHPTQGRTYERPLSAAEYAFFLEGNFNKTTDIMQHFELRLLNSSQNTHLFSEDNIVRAWLSTKRRYPFAGATVQGRNLGLGTTATPAEVKENTKDDDDTRLPTDLRFVVRECDLSSRSRDIIFGQVANAEEARRRAASILDGPRLLSEALLVQLYVFHETGADKTQADTLHVVTLAAHCMTDEMANRALARCFLDTLARGGRPDSEPAQMPLEDRLATAVPVAELEPTYLRLLSPARRRWRRAAAAIILQMMFTKLQGGHTLPCRLRPTTSSTIARPGSVNALLTHTQSVAVIAKCRQHKITFGNAYLALAQVAMTRVFYRRYLRGEISEEEWTYRKRQPYITMGPMNLRPYLDKAWFENGGGGEFMLSISGFFFQLPFMTLGGTDEGHTEDRDRFQESGGAPPFSKLLTFNRFLYRAGSIKKQSAAFFNNPLFLDIVHMLDFGFAAYRRQSALQAMEHVNTDAQDASSDDNVLAVTDIPMMRAHGGASLGNLDPIFPSEYPIPASHPLSPYSPVSHPMKAGYVTPPSTPASDKETSPTLSIAYSKARTRTSPGELYLGAVTERGQLDLYIYYDRNVFEDEVVQEWLDELKEAVLWYLG